MWLNELIDKIALKKPKKGVLPTHNKKGQVFIRNLSQYRELLKEGQTEFDFSELDITYEDIQQIDLSNLGLNINLQEIFYPFNGSGKYYNRILKPIGRLGDDFIYLNRSNLKGNNVIGELTNAVEEYRGYDIVCTFIYSVDTFDDEYKNAHPQYFLDSEAPSELKEKYYNPLVKKEFRSTLYDIEGKEEKTVYYRQPLTFEEYMQYYQFLKGKYIDRFRIKKLDYSKIKLVETLGLEQIKQAIEALRTANVDPSLFLSSIGTMSSDEIKTSVLGSNEQQNTELLDQIGTAMKKVIKK